MNKKRHLSRQFWLVLIALLLTVSGCNRAMVETTTANLGITPSISPQVTPSITSTSTPLPTSTSTHTTVPPTATATFTPTASPTATPLPTVIFAAIGDYGTYDNSERDVANLVLSWQPDFIITLGDNNYPSGAADTMDAAVGQFFHSFIYPYKGEYGEGAPENRFFPCLGNHDLITEDGKPYFDYFTLPGNRRYYDFTWGSVHLFALNDVGSEPDGVGESSIQAMWLKDRLVASTSAWNIVYMHYPPYSSGTHGSTDWARWPYAEWGADAVLSGHDHTYERLEEGGLVYFVNGLGGGGIYNFENILDGSQVRFNGDYGAMRMEASATSLQFEFITQASEVVDVYTLTK